MEFFLVRIATSIVKFYELGSRSFYLDAHGKAGWSKSFKNLAFLY